MNQDAVNQGCNAGIVNDDEHASNGPRGERDLRDIEIEELRR